jgi:hypothetical protein
MFDHGSIIAVTVANGHGELGRFLAMLTNI